MNTTLVLLLAYAALQVGVGLWIGRRVRSSGDFFVAGRALSSRLVFATLLAANIGAGSTVGAASFGYRDGWSAWWWNGSAGIASLVLAFWLGPRIWRIARERGFLTLGDFLEHRYGRGVRALTAVLLWLGALAILAGQLIGVASILAAVAGQPRWVGALVGAGVMVAYFVAGGLLSSAWVNLVQLVVLLGGFLVATPLALAAAGGFEGIRATEGLPPDFFGFWSGGQSGVTLLALFGPSFLVSPGIIQKVYGARDERAVRLGVAATGIALMLFAALPPLLGMVARARHPDLASIDLALPTVLAQDLPPAVGVLALAAIFSAEVSSADAVLFILATSLSQDLYRRFLRPDASDADLLRVARGAAIVGGAAGILLALVLPTVSSALIIFYGLLTVVPFVPVVAAISTRKAGRPEALASIVGGVATMFSVALASNGRGVAGWRPDSIGLAVAATAFAAVAAARWSRR